MSDAYFIPPITPPKQPTLFDKMCAHATVNVTAVRASRVPRFRAVWTLEVGLNPPAGTGRNAIGEADSAVGAVLAAYRDAQRQGWVRDL